MALSKWIRSWKRSLDRRWALHQALRRKAVARRSATRPRLETLEDRWLLSTYTVTSAADSGSGTLRDAITMANSVGSTINEIDFKIPGTPTINLQSQLPALTASGVYINGFSQAGSGNTTPLVTLNGSLAGSSGVYGLGLSGPNCSLSGLIIEDFSGEGVLISSAASGNLVLGNYIGGSTGLGNSGDGIAVEGSGETIGGTATGASNVLSGNGGAGLDVTGSNVLVQGNYIGTDTTGTTGLGNSGDGIFIDGTNGTVGGTVSASRNIISGNDAIGIAVGSSGGVVLGNYIGTDPAGTKAIGNGTYGIELSGQFNTIGGTASGAGNVISGNSYQGIQMPGASGDVVLGNYIGTDATGAKAIPNSLGGILMLAASGNGTDGNTIGGTVSGARNIISGNSGYGVRMQNNSTGNLVQGNYIGTDVTGAKAISNSIGIDIASSDNTIGGSASGALNVISGNSSDGVYIDGVTGTVVQGNYIGTDVTGTKALANSIGIYVVGDSNIVGGTASGAGNVVSGNTGDGVWIDKSDINETVEGNWIGIAASGTIGLANNIGIEVAGGNNTIGGTVSGARNVISGNTTDGVLIDSPGGQNQVLGNWIGTNYNGTVALANSVGVEVSYNSSNSNTVGGTTSYGNVISGNATDGVYIDTGVSGTLVQGNTIGATWYDGAALPNSGNGIEVKGSYNTLGASYSVAFNEISGNSGDGVLLYSGSSGNVVLGSYIGTNHSGTAALANSVGIEDDGSGNLIGGSVLGDKNVISGNTTDGVLITGTDETMQGNYIGSNYDTSTSIANGSNGVEIQGTGNTIGGNGSTTSLLRDYILGNNKGDGIKIDSGASGNQVLDDFIGVEASGKTGLANSVGVEIGGSHNTVGGTTNAYTNVISGNTGDGVLVDSTGAGNVIQGSFIGTDYTGAVALANSGNGVEIAGNNNMVGGTASGTGDIIANNSSNGVLIDSIGSGDSIRQNSIYANMGLGISLASGANNNIAAPTNLGATLSGGTLTVTGNFTAPVTGTYYVEIFADSATNTQGRIFLGTATVVVTSTGTQTFNFSTTNTSQLSTYPEITATLTDTKDDTSEFSNGVPS